MSRADTAAATKARILDVALAHFAELGYEQTTNKVIADDAEVTTGSIYYYYASKIDLYVQVFDEVQRRVYDRFTDATEGTIGLVDGLTAVFETSHAINREEPLLAAFLAGSRIDQRRHPEIVEALGPGDPRRIDFFERIVERGVANGEIPVALAEEIIQAVRAFAIGLVDGYSDDLEQQRLAIDGFMHTLRALVRAHEPV